MSSASSCNRPRSSSSTTTPVGRPCRRRWPRRSARPTRATRRAPSAACWRSITRWTRRRPAWRPSRTASSNASSPPASARRRWRCSTTRPTWKNSVRLLRTGPLDSAREPGRRPARRGRRRAGPQTPDDRGPEEDFKDVQTATKRPPTGGMGGPALRLGGVQARQEQRHRAGQGRHGGRRRGRPDEPGGLGPYGGAQGRRPS